MMKTVSFPYGKEHLTYEFGDELIAALENGGNIKDAVRYASAAGALTVAKKGAADSVPTKDEVLAFLEKNPF